MSEIELKEIFSRNLSNLMETNNVKNNQLAEHLGVSESTVGKWILKKSLPRMGLIEKIALYFGINKSDLVEDKNITKEEIKEQQQIKTIAAHFDGDMTEEEMEEIINYVKYVKSKRK